MLVLSRKIGQRIVIPLGDGESIAIGPVPGKRGAGVRLGVEAPPRFLILREEHLPGDSHGPQDGD